MDVLFAFLYIGITRLERWGRAAKHGLNPPPEVKEILLKHSQDDNYTQWYLSMKWAPNLGSVFCSAGCLSGSVKLSKSISFSDKLFKARWARSLGNCL